MCNEVYLKKEQEEYLLLSWLHVTMFKPFILCMAGLDCADQI